MIAVCQVTMMQCIPASSRASHILTGFGGMPLL